VAKGLALGATGYLSKPARPQALLTAIRTVLGI
jgi:DNA-binding NarL/FixJ family response regulator